MTDALVARARGGDDGAFAELAEVHRAELRIHCYRLLGTLPDAERVLQESLVAAWRTIPAFDGSVPVRGWLHRVATDRCLVALRDAPPPPVPPDPPFRPPKPTRTVEPQWLGPFPDALLTGLPADPLGPDPRYTAEESVELAFLTELHRLAPRTRAAVVLRDVLGLPLTDVAAILTGPEDALRADVELARAALDAREPRHAPAPSDERRLARRFARAFAADHVDETVALLTEDAALTMPPSPLEYRGGPAIASFLRVSAAFRGGRRFSLRPTRANRQPAFGLVVAEPTGSRPHDSGLVVLTVQGRRIGALTRFLDPDLVELFGLADRG